MQRTDKASVLGLVCEKMALRVSAMETTEAERVTASTLAQIQEVPAQSFVDFEVEDGDVDIENEMLDTSIAHGGGVLEEEDAVSALLSLAGCVNVVEEDMEEELRVYIYIYVYIYLFAYCCREYKFYSKTWRLFGTHRLILCQHDTLCALKGCHVMRINR